MDSLQALVREIAESGLSATAIPDERCKTIYLLTVTYPWGQRSMEGPVSALEEWWRGDDKDRAIKALEEEVAELSVTLGIRDKRIAELERDVRRLQRERDDRIPLCEHKCPYCGTVTHPVIDDSATATTDAMPLYDYVID